MADQADTKADAAEKAYEAASAAKPMPKIDQKVAEAKAAPAAAAAKPAAEKAPVKKPAAKAKPVAKKGAAKKTSSAPAKKAPAKRKPAAKKKGPSVRKVAAAVAADRAPKAPRKSIPTLTELKDTIMAKADTTDFTATAKKAAADMQTRMKAAYDKGTEMTSEVTEFTKGNVEAMVESGKILAGGMQDMGRAAVEDTKTAFETMTADMKKFAAVKSPTELFKLQGEIARRNFDAMVGYSSKNAEKAVKLANDAFAPISSRVSVAAEKVSKAA